VREDGGGDLPVIASLIERPNNVGWRDLHVPDQSVVEQTGGVCDSAPNAEMVGLRRFVW
jgi:hypothetical protein